MLSKWLLEFLCFVLTFSKKQSFDYSDDYSDDLFPLHKKYKFGHDALKHFSINPSITDFNWGAYGTPPNEVMLKQTKIRLYIESCPSCWMFYERTDRLNDDLKLMAKYLNIRDVSDLVFVINASHGLNAIIKSMTPILYNGKCGKYKDKRCKILQFSTTFPVNDHLTDFLNQNPASPTDQIKEFHINRKHLQNTELLLKDLEEYLNDNDDVFFAVISHITYSPNAILDIKRITKLFRKYSVITFVDGAWALGQIPIDIHEMDPDIWLSNGHKFFFSTRGTTPMYIRKNLHDIIYPLVVSTVPIDRSKLEGDNPMQQQFMWQGTMEDSIWMSMRPALEFRNKFGDNKIMEYIHNLAINAKYIFSDKWETELYVNDDNYIAAMICPILPFQDWDDEKQSIFQRRLLDKYGAVITIKVYDNIWFTRIMVSMYHDISDFEWIADVMLIEMNNMFLYNNSMDYSNEYNIYTTHKKKYCEY